MTADKPLHDFELDRLLANGQPGGAEREQLWSRLDAELPQIVGANQEQTRHGWAELLRGPWRKLGLGLLPAAAVAAIAILWIGNKPNSYSGLQARGESPGTPVLEATCGAPEHPCVVGEAVYLRLHSGEHSGEVTLAVVGADDERRIFGPVQLSAGQGLSVPVALHPEPGDVTGGVDVVQCFVPDSGDGQRTQLGNPAGKAPEVCQRTLLHLEVRSP